MKAWGYNGRAFFELIKEKEFSINYWRTKSVVEVDFVLDAGNIAIEVKISRRIDKKDFFGLATFAKEYQPKRLTLVCLEERRRKVEPKSARTVLSGAAAVMRRSTR